MSIRRLRTLIAVEDKGGFTAAGAAMGLTHSAVSQQMKALEAEWGVALFDRSGRRPALSPLGRALTGKAREIVAAFDGAVASVSGEAGFQGALTLGAAPTTLTGLVARTIGLIRDRRPGLMVRLVPALTLELVAQVERGALDAALVTLPPGLPDGLEWREIAREEMALIAAPDMAGDDPMALLAAAPFIRFSRKAVVGAAIESWLREQGVRVDVSMELEDLDAIESMVHAGLGVAIAPRRCVAPAHAPPLRRIALKPAPPPRVLGLIWRADHARPQVMAALLDYLKEAARDPA